jgi:hypothetical protein
MLKIDTVSFGEPIPADVLEVCQRETQRSDCMLVAGTSATVYPAAWFPMQVRERGGHLIEVNLYESELTPLCTVSLRGTATSCRSSSKPYMRYKRTPNTASRPNSMSATYPPHRSWRCVGASGGMGSVLPTTDPR